MSLTLAVGNITIPDGGDNLLNPSRCYTCRYASYKIPTHELINDPNCHTENPQLKLPCPFETCSIWTFSLIVAGRNLETTGKVCVTAELKKCYETVTGVTLQHGQCKKVAKLSLEQLKILTSGDCGIKTSSEESSQEVTDDPKEKPEGNERWIFDLENFKLEDILKNDYNYEVCVCKGDLCNDYRKLKLNDNNGYSCKSCMNILLLALLAVYYFKL